MATPTPFSRDQLDIHLRTASDLIEDQKPSGIYFYLTDNTAAALEAEFRAAGNQTLSPLAPREWNLRLRARGKGRSSPSIPIIRNCANIFAQDDMVSGWEGENRQRKMLRTLLI
jgi:hypothetical protein